MSSARTRAWVMDVGAGRRVAAGTHHVVEYLLSPNTISVPLAPAYCPAVLIWREQLIPSVDLAGLSSSAEPASRQWHGAVVLAYQEAPREPLRYGALLVYAAPKETWVTDAMACPLPEESKAFRYFTSACFTHEERAIPVVDTTRLFSEPPPEVPSSYSDDVDHVSSAMETTPATVAGSDASGPSEESAEALEQEVFASASWPQATAPPAAQAEGTTELAPPDDAGLIGTHASPEPVAASSEGEPDEIEQSAPKTDMPPDTNHTEAVAEITLEEREPVQRQDAQEEPSTTGPSAETVEALKPELLATESPPGIAVQAAASVEDTTELAPPEDADLFGADSSPETVAPSSDVYADIIEQSPSEKETLPDANHTETVAEVTLEEHEPVQRQDGQEESDAAGPSDESVEALERDIFGSDSWPDITDHPAAPVEETTELAPPEDPDLIGSDASPEAAAASSDVYADLIEQSPSATETLPDTNHTEAVADGLPEERRPERSKEAQQESDTPEPFEETVEALEQHVFASDAWPEISDLPAADTENITGVAPSDDANLVEGDTLPELATPSSETQLGDPARIPPVAEPPADVDHEEAFADITLDEGSAAQQQEAQQESETFEPLEKFAEALEQDAFASDSWPEITDLPATPVDDAIGLDPPEDSSLIEVDASSEPDVTLFEAQPDALAQIPPVTEPPADLTHDEGIAEISPEEYQALVRQQTREGSDTQGASAESAQALEQDALAPDSWPEITELPDAPIEDPTEVAPADGLSLIELDALPEPAAFISKATPDALAQMPPPKEPLADAPNTEAVAETSPEERRALRRQQAQRIIGETLSAVHYEVGLNRVFFAVPRRGRKSIRADYYCGLETDSPLRQFQFEAGDSSLFARLVEKPQHIWLRSENRSRLTQFLSPELRESLGESEFFASSVFVRSKLVGVFYGDEFPSTDGLDEHDYEQFKDLCTDMAKRLGEIAA